MSRRCKYAALLLCLLLIGLLPAGCSPFSSKQIAIGSKPFTENVLLAEMLAQLTEAHTKIKVERKFNLSNTLVAFDLLKAGSIDLYPEYTGTGLVMLLNQPPQKDAAKAYQLVQEAFNRQYRLKWLQPYGFNNTSAIAVNASLAKARRLRTISDLAPHAPSLVFAANLDFYMSPDGFNSLVKAYGLNFKDKKQMDIGPRYEALVDERVDVVNTFATDGLLAANELTVLADDKHFFPAYQAATLARMETLRQYPELEPVLNKLAGQLSDADMQQLNHQVDQQQQPVAEVARKFLSSRGLLPAKK